MLEEEEDFIEYIKSVKYLVIFPDKSCKMLFTLREVASEICVDHTTIFKKLKNNVHCFVESKQSGFMFYIRKISKL